MKDCDSDGAVCFAYAKDKEEGGSVVERITRLTGPRFELELEKEGFPKALTVIDRPPRRLYGIGSPEALQEGLAVVGARRATPYGLGCARMFALRAARRGIAILSGGARGCDACAHEAALEAGAKTVVFLGGGCDQLYPMEHAPLFQRIVDRGGAVISEHPWEFPPKPFAFRERNRLIAGLARATLIVEAGLPSGTFSTADEALSAGKEVLVVPGSIVSPASRGANRLLRQGAVPVVDEESFDDELLTLFGCLKEGRPSDGGEGGVEADDDELLQAVLAQPMGLDQMRSFMATRCGQADALTSLMIWIARRERDGLIARYPDGRYGPVAHRTV